MGILNFIGFETGDLAEAFASTGSVSATTSPVRSGSYALDLNITGTNTSFAIRKHAADGSPADFALGTLYLTVLYRMAALPGSGVNIFQVRNSGGTVGITLQQRASGAVRLTAPTAGNGADGPTLSIDTWYRVDFKYVQNGTCECQIDGGTVFTGTADNLQADEVLIGGGGGTRHFYFDDLIVADNALPGASRVVRMGPDGNGNYTAWTGSATDVDELPHDGDMTYITSSTSGQAETESLASPASAGVVGAVRAVKSCAVVRDEGGASSLAVRLRCGATDNDTSNNDPGSSYVLRAKVYEADPADAAPWTPDDLAALEVGVVNNANVAVRCTLVSAMVLCSGSVPVAMASHRRRRT